MEERHLAIVLVSAMQTVPAKRLLVVSEMVDTYFFKVFVVCFS